MKRSHSLPLVFRIALAAFALTASRARSAWEDNPAARTGGARVTFPNADSARTTGDPFAGGRWTSQAGGQASVESRFARVAAVKSVDLTLARFGPFGSKGKIAVFLLKPSGEPLKVKEFANVQICPPGQVPPASSNAALPPQSLPFNPPAPALGLRLEFQGEGPFVLERAQVHAEPGQAAPSTPDSAQTKPARTDPDPRAEGQWILATRSGLRRDAILVLARDGERLSGFWDFARIDGGMIGAQWTGAAFAGQAELGENGPLKLTLAVSSDGQRLNAAAEPAGAGPFVLGFVKQPKPDQEGLDAWIKIYAAERNQIRNAAAAPANGAPDFSGVWVEDTEADDTDLRHLRLAQQGLRVTGEFVSPKGTGPFQGFIRDGVLYATATDPGGLRKTYRIQLSESGDELDGLEGRYEGAIPGTPHAPWKRVRAIP